MERGNKVDSISSVFANKGGHNVHSMRPYISKHDGLAYVAVWNGGDPKKKSSFTKKRVDNAALRYDEWRTLDDAVIRVAEERLVGYDDLTSRGLVYNLNNAMATTVLTWEQMSDALEAEVSIDPVNRGDNDVVDFAPQHIPIPIVHVDYQLGERLLQESRTRGNGLDTNNAERAARKVAEKLEDMLFGSTATMVYGGGTIHSYISHPDNNDVTLSVNWDASAKTAAQILDDVRAMKQALVDDKHYGPYVLYVPGNYELVLDEDYSVSGNSVLTIKERILKMNNIESVRVVDKLADDTVLLVQMTRDVVDVIQGMPMQNIEWRTEGGMMHHYKVMTIQVPRVKSDYNSTSGVCVLS